MILYRELQSQEELANILVVLHGNLLRNGEEPRMISSKNYHKLVEETRYEVGDRENIYSAHHKMEKGRKLQS